MALQGKSFCNSAHDGYYLIFRNPTMFSLVSGIGKIFIFFATLFIVFSSTILGYLMITKINNFSTILYSPVMPTIVKKI